MATEAGPPQRSGLPAREYRSDRKLVLAYALAGAAILIVYVLGVGVLTKEPGKPRVEAYPLVAFPSFATVPEADEVRPDPVFVITTTEQVVEVEALDYFDAAPTSSLNELLDNADASAGDEGARRWVLERARSFVEPSSCIIDVQLASQVAPTWPGEEC